MAMNQVRKVGKFLLLLAGVLSGYVIFRAFSSGNPGNTIFVYKQNVVQIQAQADENEELWHLEEIPDFESTQPLHPAYHEKSTLWKGLRYMKFGGKHMLINLEYIAAKAGFKSTMDPTDNVKLLWAYKDGENDNSLLENSLSMLMPHMKFNQIPGLSEASTMQSLLEMSVLKRHIPKTFIIPRDLEAYSAYAEGKPNTYFLRAEEENGETYLQKLIDKPLLIDGHKFDLTVQVAVTSINPVRIYVYNNFWIQFCKEPYEPFDPSNLDKFVVSEGVETLPGMLLSWKMLLNKGYSQKRSFKEVLRTMGQNPDRLIGQMNEIIISFLTANEHKMIDGIANYRTQNVQCSFFHHLTMTFTLNEYFSWFLTKVDPNPMPAVPFDPPFNRKMATRMFEQRQMILATLKLAGVITGIIYPSKIPEEDMELLAPNYTLVTFHDHCMLDECSPMLTFKEACSDPRCQLCQRCQYPDLRWFLREAVMEQEARTQFLRIYPNPLGTQEKAQELRNSGGFDSKGLSENNWKMHQWYLGKCLGQASWCV